MSAPAERAECVNTWYRPGDELPWKATYWTSADGGETIATDTFAGLLIILGEVWAKLMPEPR